MDPDASQDTIIFNYLQSQTVPGGGSNARATLAETNMPGAGQLPLRHQMVVFSVMIRYDEAITNSDAKGKVHTNQPGTLAAYQDPTFAEGLRKWNNIRSNMIFQLVVEGNKPYVEGHLDHFPAGGGLWSINSPESTISTGSVAYLQSYFMNNGESGAHAGRRLAMPIHIGALEQFQGLLRLPRGALANWTNTLASSKTGYGITVYLNGPRQRPVG